MLPKHFHIDHDQLEASHLLSALVLETGNMINNVYSSSFIKNQYFRNAWRQYLRRDLRVPPENTKDYVLSMGIHMQNGEWTECKGILQKLRIWTTIKHARWVKKRLFSRIKRECLRCYLYRYGSVYENISLSTLSAMFELSPSSTKQFVAKLIVEAERLSRRRDGDTHKFASIDEINQCVVMHRQLPSPPQKQVSKYCVYCAVSVSSFFFETGDGVCRETGLFHGTK